MFKRDFNDCVLTLELCSAEHKSVLSWTQEPRQVVGAKLAQPPAKLAQPAKLVAKLAREQTSKDRPEWRWQEPFEWMHFVFNPLLLTVMAAQ